MNMTSIAGKKRRFNVWRIIGWGGTVALVLAPLIAMQFTAEVNWNEADFLCAAIIFAIVGGLIEVTVRTSTNRYFRFGSVFAVLTGFMVIWSNLAVGMIGNQDNRGNLWFGIVLIIAILGSMLSRYAGWILPHAMFAAGAAQTAMGFSAGFLGSDPCGGMYTVMLSAGWFVSGLLLWCAHPSASRQ